MPFAQTIESERALRDVLPPAPAKRLSADKQIDFLDEHARAWIAAAPLVFVGTANEDGACDVSPRGGPAGWVRVLDERRVALPDAPGNRRADSFRNVLANPGVGLLFVVPGRREVLRVNGRGCVTTDPELLHGIPGEPKLALGVDVDEVFIHCGKALIRSRLWEPEAWPPADALPSAARILRDHAAINGRGESVEQAEEQFAESYAKRLW